MVNNQRIAEGVAQFTAQGSYATPIAIGGVSSGGSFSLDLGWFGYAVVFTAACVVVGFFAFLSYSRHEVPLNSYNFMGASTGGHADTAKLQSLFKPGTVLKTDHYEGINWARLNALRSQAKKPATFEQDLCTALHHPLPIGTPEDLTAKWSVNANGYCVATEAQTIGDRAKSHNRMYALMNAGGAVAVLCVIALLMLKAFRAKS
jgi:hypothetical protein